jgi:ATP-dependent DNA helicase RecG
VDRVLARLRNLTIRALPDGTLFPIELSQYDPWVIREALHNCIAHQDYGLAARVNIVESPSAIRLTNAGTFLPGDVESVIRQDAPQEIYRNPFLAEAMVGLNMIDTQGGGIKRMFQTQARRFFPLPDYDLSQPYRVVVTVRGTILDEQYCRLLMERSDLDLDLIILLDKVQKRVSITREQHRLLRRAGLVEGRFPTVMISGPVARLAGQPARHIRERGLERRYYLDMVATLVAEHGPVSRSEIDRLLMDKLPDILTPAQKRNRIHNILSVLSQEHRIRNAGSRPKPKWVAGEGAPTKSIKRESKMSQG